MMRLRYSILLVVLAMVPIVAPHVVSSISTGNRVFAEIPHPIVFRYDFNFTIVDVLTLNITHSVLVVSYGGYSAVIVVNLVDPVGGARIEQSYPLAGKVTAIAVDGYPPTRFAVGSDRGEIYLFRIGGGRLYKLLHLIQGADFRILSLFVARAADRYKLIATVSEGYPTGLCTNCYVYVFDENLLGAFVISPHVTTTVTGYYKRVYPQIAVPAKVYTPSGYYYKADSVALFWAPYIDTVVAELNISQLVNATAIEPARGALIEISVLDPVTRVIRVYGWNADEGGRAFVPIPRGYLANVTVVGSTRKFLLKENVNTTAIAKRFKIEAVIPEKVSIDLAEEIYGLPFFAKYYIDFLDLTGAPESYRVLRSLDKEFYPTVSLPQFIGYGGGYIIAITNRSFLEIYDLDHTLGLRSRVPIGVEYLGMAPPSIVDVIACSRDNVIIGFSDGRIKHYVFNSLRNSYDFAQAIVTLGSLVRMVPLSNSSYFTFSTRGVQIVVLTPFQLPILRTGLQAEFSVEGLVSASALPGAELVALATPSSLYTVINLNRAITVPIPVNLDNYRAPSLIVKVLPPVTREQVGGSRVILRYEIEGKEREIAKTLTRDNVTFANVVPGMRYSILVIPPRDYIHNYTTVVDVPYCEERCRDVVIQAKLRYRDFAVKLILRDEFGGALLGRIRVVIDDKVYSYVALEGLDVRLLYGYHNVTIESLDRYYQTLSTRIRVEADAELIFVLERARYNLTIVLTDELTRRVADPRFTVYINGSAHYPNQASILSVTIPAGATNITAAPFREISSIYRSYSATVIVNRSSTIEVVIGRAMYRLTILVLDELTKQEIFIKASIRINGTDKYRDIHLPRDIYLPCAYYVIEVIPVEEYVSIFSIGVTELLLDSDGVASIVMPRNTYILDVFFRDAYSEKPVVPLRVLLNGSHYSVLMAPSLSLPLRAANYVVRVEPVEEHSGSYIPVEKTLRLVSNTRLVIDIVRQNYTLTLRFIDTSVRGYLEGQFKVSLNTTVTVVDGPTASRGFSVSLPYGKYLLTITPTGIAEKVYAMPPATIINVFSNMNHTARLSRKLYVFTVTVVNDLEERVSNAYVQVIDPSTGLELSSMYTNENGEVRISLPAGAILIRIAKGGYAEYSEAIYLDRDIALTPRLRPTLLTIVGRFAHVIALTIVSIAIIVIALKLRAKLAERLTTTEEIF